MSKPQWENDNELLKGTLGVAKSFKALLEMQIHNKVVQLESIVQDAIDKQENIKELIKERTSNSEVKREQIEKRIEKIKEAKEKLKAINKK